MASFDLDADLAGDRAFRLAVNGPVTLFWRPEVLAETTQWLADHGYQLVRLDAGTWATQADFHRDVKAALDFPDYYGHNLDALNDCLRDVARYEYGAARDATGTVLVFTGYDAFAGREPRAAQVILDIIATAARGAMLVGHRLLCLVQSNDAGITFDGVGATPVRWNPVEWRDDQRR
ncbi:barstar family protein [Actinophytocola sp.]|uniref:barstar family protein n=1 Tax=Actinophytocola sp. TaxID=1872138 RepID=UPI00389AD5F3